MTDTAPPLETLALTIEDKIAHVELNRPDKRNAMNQPFWEEFPKLMDWLSGRSDVRCVVISGQGKMFTAGLDLSDAQDLFNAQGDAGRVREKFLHKVRAMQETFTAIERCRVPVIAAVHNGCLGAGVDLVTACCLRTASKDAYFTIQEINIGIVADVGTLQRAPHLLPQGLVRELAYTGRPLGAAEAQAHGFINRMGEDRQGAIEQAFDLARTIASKSPLAMTGIKQTLTYARDHGVDDALNQVATWNAGMLLSEDVMKAVQAVMTKSEAEYNDLL